MSAWRALAAVCGLAIGCAAAARAPADEPEPAPPGAPPPFRRIFIPAGEIGSRQWTGRYLSIDADEFEQLLQTVDDGARGAPGVQNARVEKADYTAQVVGDDLLVGSATLELAPRSDQPMLLALDPWSVALESAVWKGRTQKPAVLGAGPDGRLKVLVEGSQLECRWSQRGERTPWGSVTFHLQLPGCPMTRIALEVPAGLEVVANHGIVTKTSASARATNHWMIELGGHNQVTLRMVPEDSGRRPLTLLRQSLFYEFSPRGIDVRAQLRLDVHGEPLKRVTIDLDPSLHLVGAKYGKLSVPWSATTDANTGQQRVLLEFPEPLTGTGRVLQLSAMAPLAAGRRVPLPGLQPRDMAWQEGTAELLIPDALELKQLRTKGCRQSRVTALPAPLAGESIEIQYYEPGATIEVLVDERRRRLAVESGTLVEVGTGEITSRCAFGADVPPGERRRLSIPIRAAWTVDTVERLQSNRPVEWELDEPPGRPAALKIVVAEAGRFVVRGHRAAPSASTFDAAQLQMLDFSEFERATRLISVRAVEGWDLHWTGSEKLNRRDAANLDSGQSQLFAQLPDGPVFSEDESFAQSSVTRARRKPNYAADIHIDVAVRKNTLSETYTIQCAPDAARVERLLVRFSQARDVPLEWNLAGGNSGKFSARKLSAAEQDKAGLPPGGEVWELLLQLARPGAFELRAHRSIPFTGETPLALVSVDDATTQHGTLAIRALGETGLSIENRRLMSVPAELLEPDRYQTARATYHYQPSGDDLRTEPAVSIAPAKPQPAETGAWAWIGRLESRFAADGTCVHLATFRIQTGGRRQIRAMLPEGAKLLSAWVDDQRLPLVVDALAAKGQLIELPPGRSRATVSLYYSTVADLPAFATRQTPPFPTLDDMPIVLRQWSVWLPPGYEITDADRRAPIDELSPPTWSQRLFGPLGRGETSHVFNPLVGSDWREISATGTGSRQVYRDCEQLIRNLGMLLGDYRNDEELTWGQLLWASSENEAAYDRVLLVDAESLARLGVTPQTRVGSQSADLPLQRGLGLLRHANLRAIAAPGVVLFTGAEVAASYRGQLGSPRPGVIHTVLRGSLADELHGAAQKADWSSFETVELWRSGLAYEPPNWTWPEQTPLAACDPRGWSHYTLECSETVRPQIRIVHTAAMRSAAWAVFLAVVAMGLWKPIGKAWSLVALVGCAAALALIVPAGYAPLASAALVAGLFCLAARMTHVQPAKSPTGEHARASHKSRTGAIQQVATMLLAGAVVNAAAALDAAPPGRVEPPTAPKNARAGMYRVFVPVDADQKPVGDKLYVPDELYEDLLRKAAEISGRPKDWIITRGTYQGTLARDPATSRLELVELKARFDLRVFQANVPVRVPLARESWSGAITGARLDGRTIPVEWNAAGDGLILGPLPAEQYRLELELRPSALSDAPRAGIDLPIPKLPQTTLELTVPPDGPAIEAPGARGQVLFDQEGGRLVAQLGASGRLSLRWPTGGGMEGAAANLEVEELIWVKVRPGTTVLDVRFKYRVLAGRVRQLQLLTDPRLSLLSSPDSQSQVTAVHTIPGDPQRIELELARDVSDEVVVDLSFLVTGTSGVGHLRLPRLESADARATRRWLGVSVDSALQPRIQFGEDSRSLDIGEFMAAWGSSQVKPYAAYSIPRGEPVWVLSTQPSKPQTYVEQTLAVSLGRNSARLQLDAEISIEGGVLVQLELQGPPGIVIDQVSMLEDDVQRVARWSVDPSGRISVFLTAPIDGRQQLSLRGRWVPATPGEFQAPRLRVLSADVKKDHLHIYRQPAVLAILEKSAGTRELPPAEIELREGFGSLGGCYSLEDDTATVRVKLSPNNPRLNAVAMMYLERDGDRWMAELNYHVDVTGGLADTLHFEIPPQWSEPFRIDSAMRYEVVSLPGEQRRELVLYPDEPLEGKQQIRIRGRVAPSPGDRLSVPDVVPLGAQQLERFVVLPRHLERQQVTWDTLGLLPAELPAEFMARGSKVQSMAVYKVAGEHFQASLKAVERASAVAHVELLDIHLVWQADGSYQAVAAFDIEPAGSTQCVLELPPGCRLVHATVEQLPPLVVALGENRWQLGLGPQQLPQRIEVLYTGSSQDSALHKHFQAPRLVDLDVGQTLWTIYGLPRFGPAEARDANQRVTPAEHQLKRLSSIAALVELPAEVVGEHLPEEIARWYRSWRMRYRAARGALRSELIAAGRHTARSEESIAARGLDDRIRSVDERLAATRIGSRRVSLGNASTQLAALARETMRPVHYVGGDESDRLELRYARTAADPFPGRLLAGLAILFAAGAMAWWLRSRTLPTFAPWLVASGLGLAWWLLLAPSVLGLLAFVVASSTGLWSRWRAGPRTQSV